MKKFALHVCIWLVLAVVVVSIYPMYLYFTKKYQLFGIGSETYVSINKSKKKHKSKILLLGDSVAKQLFDNNQPSNDTINSLTCNQAIGMVGQYLLLKNYIDAGNTPESVVLLITPFTLSNNLDQIFTYQYFLKPFNTAEYKDQFTATVNEQVNKIPYHYFSQLPQVLTSDWSPNFVSKDKKEYAYLSPITDEYINKIKLLAKEHHFKFCILPAPVKAERKIDFAKLDDEVGKTNFKNEFENFVSTIIFFPNNLFIDEMHFKKEIINSPLGDSIKAIIATEILNSLK